MKPIKPIYKQLPTNTFSADRWTMHDTTRLLAGICSPLFGLYSLLVFCSIWDGGTPWHVALSVSICAADACRFLWRVFRGQEV